MLKQTFVSAVLVTAVVGGLSAQVGKPTARPTVKPVTSHAPATTTMLPAEQTALVKQYCAGCHSERGKAG